ncbi:MAG TPA: chemotaxis protein CheB [Steroidobacteraceae bacterium]|nr:chemotaxis protein CheB [Steroidobacteraceae bacterium]
MSNTSDETPDGFADQPAPAASGPGEEASASSATSTPAGEDSTSPGPRLPPIIGVGASAGGLESLEKLFRALPARTGAAFVVVQHLSPDFKSLMDELLARFTDLTIHRAATGVKAEADHVYLLQPGKELEIRDGRFELFDRDPNAGLTLPIDRFLSSLAQDAGARAAAVILSGSGSDGSRGVKRIHACGGMVLVEDPDTARFDGMPRAAIAAGIADCVAPAEELAGALLEFVSEGPRSGPESALLADAFIQLRGILGIDFAQYKLPTVVRRIRRRASLRRLPNLEAYTELLRTDERELAALGHDLLIGVTRFFRDPAVWESIESRIIPRLAAESTPESGLRAWVAGCATGEEAYSVAMLLLDATAARSPPIPVKVFATDVHSQALERAGQGIYDPESLANVDERRRRQYFIARSDGRFQVAPHLRHAVVFARHDLLKDAPFTQLDFVSCRNLLIYFRPAAQKHALSILPYGLRIGGAMLLGPSEAPGEIAGEFEVVDEACRIYVKRRLTRRPPVLSMSKPVSGLHRTRPQPADTPLLSLYDAVLDHVMPPSFLIDGERSIVDSFGGAERLLRVRRRRASTDFLDLVPDTARLALAAGLARAARERTPIRFDGIEWPTAEGDGGKVDLRVDPLESDGKPLAYLVSIVAEGSCTERSAGAPRVDMGEMSAERFAALEQELKHARETLQSTLQELESSGEEMQATNEELTASNEELQSTNEELHSVNEELHTVNAELQAKIQELSDLNHDMRLLFENIETAIVFLDGELRIRRFTPRAAALFGLLEHDQGRPFTAFQHPFRRVSLMEDIAACRETGQAREYEVLDNQGGTHLVRITHYLGPDGASGLVLSVTDLTALAAAHKRVELLSSIVASTGDPVIGLDHQQRVTAWNPAAVRLYGFPEEEALGSPLEKMIPRERRAEFRAAFEEAWGGSVVSLEAVQLHRKGTPITISTTLSALRDRDGSIIGVSKVDHDIRERKQREEALAERERLLANLYDHSPDMFAFVDLESGRMLECNATLQRTLGYAPEELSAIAFRSLFTPESREALLGFEEDLRRTGEVRDAEMTLVRRNGARLDVSLSATGERDETGRVVRSRCVVHDITVQRQASQALLEASRIRERFLAVVSHELRTPLYAIRSATSLLAHPSVDQATRQRALEVLNRQASQMTRLLGDLLDVSLITHSRFELSRVPLDLREPVRTAIDAVVTSRVKESVRIVAVLPEEPLPLLGDPARLEQVFTNLLNNAVRHSPVGGKVVVSLERCGARVRAAVTDEGDGIAPEQLQAIFELFSRTRDPAIRSNGLGLGLGIARRIVAGHDGRIYAESEGLGRGSRFVLDLPLHEASLTRAAAGPRSRARVVLIEDQEDARDMAKSLLEMRGHEVIVAVNGSTGVQAIVEHLPDVALVDIGLPDIDGYTVVREVQERLGRSIPLIALTGLGQPEDVKRSHEAGFARHLTKPFDIENLDQVIREFCARPPAQQSSA